eukprot:5985219-Pyramimonas_sp.AAC.1
MQEEAKTFSDNAQTLRDKVKRLKDEAKAAKDAGDKPAEQKSDGEAALVLAELRGLGPPTATVFCAMVESLAEEEVGRANRQTLEA